MSEYPNIIWILVDSVRSYPTDKDDRGKLPMMERFGEHSVEFLNVVTSAPSTIMAVSAMMTSLPPYMIARNYDDFMFDNRYFICLNDLLKKHGYFAQAFFRHPHPREKLSNLLEAVPRKFWASHLRHRNTWSNTDLRVVLNNVLDSGIPRPAFLFVHFTCRKDPNSSEIVENALQDLVNAGFSYENTIYVLCSDHGYPDPSRGFTPEGLKQQDLTHDLMLTDDNIKIPLYFKYPGCVPRKISTTVSSLDIMPTILDLAAIPLDEHIVNGLEGASLRPLMERSASQRPGSDFVRSDARLMYQTGRITAIRNDHYKYLRYHDKPKEKNEALYDLVNDPLEGVNIAASTDPAIQSALASFRVEFERQEQDAFRRQVNYVLFRFRDQVRKRVDRSGFGARPKRVLMLIEPATAGYGELALEVLRQAWPQAKVDLLLHETAQVSGSHFAHLYSFTMDEATQVYKFSGEQPKAEYDVQLVFTINPSKASVRGLLQLSRRVRAGKTIVLDSNMNACVRRRFWYYRIRSAVARLRYVFEEPLVLWSLLTDTYRVLFERLQRRT